MNNKRINKDIYFDSPYEIVMVIYSETLVVVQANLAEKPETGQKTTPATVININKLGVLGDVQAEIVQTGDHSSFHKQIIPMEKKKSILRRMLKIIGAIIIGIIGSLIAAILFQYFL